MRKKNHKANTVFTTALASSAAETQNKTSNADGLYLYPIPVRFGLEILIHQTSCCRIKADKNCGLPADSQ